MILTTSSITPIQHRSIPALQAREYASMLESNPNMQAPVGMPQYIVDDIREAVEEGEMW